MKHPKKGKKVQRRKTRKYSRRSSMDRESTPKRRKIHRDLI